MPDEPTHPRHRDIAVAALLREDRRVLLIRTRRLPDHWQPVGGGFEPGDGDDPRSAAARELREELGLDLPRDALRDSITAPYDFGEGRVHFFVANLPPASRLGPPGDEIVQMRWWKLSEAVELPAFPATRRFLEHLERELGEIPVNGDRAVTRRSR